MKEAFTYMFKDNKFWIKGLSYLCLFFTANLFLNYAQTLLPQCPKCAVSVPCQYWVCFLIGTVINFVALGYIFSCIKALIEQKENPSLPFVNVLKDLYKGFKYAISFLLLILPLMLLTVLITYAIAAITSCSFAGFIISKIIYTAIFIFLVSLFIGFNWMFANKESFLNFFQFKKVFELIGANKKRYIGHLLLILVVFIINMILETGFIVSSALLRLSTICGLVYSGIFAAITGTYAAFVICKLTADSIKPKTEEI